ncbi:Endonuclease/exonuclease/phosphatase [Isosphaera pallida ATCC 43644]|uniref:Endonuclease/exonuclease/phosphatase n=1 Tax=Isosphaera pallida (strain ATCC 43644 / DSM 9630 / IS1B) TaxID=575540 RepID=E8R1M0_ISOPI|nr:endonuclease/exonuclease/phosphatase family protein [Isosphaera pallida]ADV63438.1 Endonuclease/exonuclease/phosphatase [Isosphaera pallida ATCC 43644]
MTGRGRVFSAVLLMACWSCPLNAQEPLVPPKPPGCIRVATFNVSLNRPQAGGLIASLATPDDPQARVIAEVIQRVAPDVILLNEFDYDPDGVALDAFQTRYLAVSQNGAPPRIFPHHLIGPVNTGVPSGRDLDKNGQIVGQPGQRGYGEDCLGYGQHPGQYGMALLSVYPIRREALRDFQTVLWSDMPNPMLPRNPQGNPWYDAEDLKVFRLSSKSHWDVPIDIDGVSLNILASHPTPPAFDGPERRNVARNHDEIRLWADYLSGPPKSSWLNAKGVHGSLEPPRWFAILGDLNSDPFDPPGSLNAIRQLLEHPRVDASFRPESPGAVEAARIQGQANRDHQGDPRYDTADFDDRAVGNLRVDYVLPARGLTVRGGGVVWPRSDSPWARLVDPETSSDHHLVYLDLDWPPRAEPTAEPVRYSTPIP